MNFAPLVGVDETCLVRKYKSFILRAVFEFCVKTTINSSHPLYEDLIVEAQLAFINECRKQRVASLDLTAREHVCAKKAMHYAMRKYFWESHNMGGYVQKKIDYDRTYVFSDYESEDDTDFQDRIPASYIIDDTELDLKTFILSLPENLRPVLRLILSGCPDWSIAEKMNLSGRMIGKYRKKIGNLYLEYISNPA